MPSMPFRLNSTKCSNGLNLASGRPTMAAYKFDHAGGDISIIFAPEAEEISPLNRGDRRRGTQSIRFMTFVFSLDELAEAMLRQAASQSAMLR